MMPKELIPVNMEDGIRKRWTESSRAACDSLRGASWWSIPERTVR